METYEDHDRLSLSCDEQKGENINNKCGDDLELREAKRTNSSYPMKGIDTDDHGHHSGKKRRTRRKNKKGRLIYQRRGAGAICELLFYFGLLINKNATKRE